MKTPYKLALRMSLAVFLLAFLGACSSFPSRYVEPEFATSEARMAFNLRVFDSAWELVDEEYFDPGFNGLDWKETGKQYRPEAAAAVDTDALYAALNRMLRELGASHLSAVKNPALDLRTGNPTQASIGMEARLMDGELVVTWLQPQGPASRAGVRPGWLWTAFDGEEFGAAGTIGTLRRAAGAPAFYTFVDQADMEHVLAIIPEPLAIQPIESRLLDEGYLYLRVHNFLNRSVVEQFRLAIEAHPDVSGIIVDLRGNSGGRLPHVRMMLGQIFSENVLMGTVVTRKGKDKEQNVWRWRSADYQGPVVALADGASASASELFLHTLQYHRRATIVGGTTAGAVLASRTTRLPDGGYLTVPGQDFVGADGERIEGRGIVPDRVVGAPSKAELRAGTDKALEAALEILRAISPESGSGDTETLSVGDF